MKKARFRWRVLLFDCEFRYDQTWRFDSLRPPRHLLVAVVDLSSGAFDSISRDDLGITGEVDIAPALARYRPDLFTTLDGSLLLHGLPILTLLDGRRFPIAGNSGRWGMGSLDMLPVAFLRGATVRSGSSPLYGSDAPGGIVDLPLNRVTTGGETGVFYGNSGGKSGREDFEAYIFGGVGNDKFQISAGAAYENSSGRGIYLRR